MDYGRAAEILGRRKWLILFSILVTAGLTWGATRLTGAKWTTAVRLIVPATSPLTDAPNSRSDAPTLDARSQATLYTSVAKSEDVVDGAIKDTKIAISPQALANAVDLDAQGQRMFELRVTDASPSRSEKLANSVAENFIETLHSLNTQQARRVVTLLEKQQNEEDAKLRAARQKYDAYCQDHKVLGSPAGQLALIFKRLELARQGKDEASARLAEAQSRLAARQMQMANMPKTVTETENADARPIVRTFEDAVARKETALIELRSHYQDRDPRVKEAQESLAELKKRLRDEKKRSENAERQNPRYNPLKETVEDLKGEVGSQQAAIAQEDQNIRNADAEIQNLRGLDSPLSALTSEITAGTEARQSIAGRLNSARAALDVAEQQSPLVIMEKAGPSNPPQNMSAGRTKKLTMLAALAALILSSGLAIAFDSLDRRLKTVQEAEIALPARVLAAIPAPTGDITMRSLPRAAEKHPLSPHAEAYHFLAQHLLKTQGKPIRSLLTISARPGQGSTNTIANLGITLAQSGHRVILVDANTRNPQLHEIFEIPNDFGLTNTLESPDIFAIKRALRPTSVPNLWVMPSGPASGNPWELFSSNRLAEVGKLLLERADYVLYDAPPATTFADTLNLATVADAALLSVRALEPLTGEEARLVERFEQAGTHVMGSVLSHVPLSLLESYRTAQPMRSARGLPAAQDERFDNVDVLTKTAELTPAQAAASAAPAPHFEPFVRPAPTVEPEPIAQPAPMAAQAADAPVPQENEAAPVFLYAANDAENMQPVVAPQAAAPQTAVGAKEPTLEWAKETENAPQSVSAIEKETAPTLDTTAVFPDRYAAMTADLNRSEAPETNAFEPSAFETNDKNTPVNVPMAAAEFAPPVAMQWDEEAFMSNANLPQTEFPRAMSGYAPSAVEEYVRLANTRVELMQRQIEQQSAMTARLMDEKNRMSAELETARNQMASSLEKEVSIASAILMTEQRRVQIEQEMEGERNAARLESERITAQAQSDAARLTAQAREQSEAVAAQAKNQADGLTAQAQDYADRVTTQAREQVEAITAQAAAQAEAQRRQAEEIARQVAQHQQDMAAERAAAVADAAQIRAQAKSEIAALLQEARRESEARLAAETEMERAALRAEVERIKADARTEAERIMAQARHEATAQLDEAKHHAEEISMYAAAAHSAHEERLQALSAECDEIVGRTRRALETQLALLPPPASADNLRSTLQDALSAATKLEQKSVPLYAPTRGEWPDESAWRSDNGAGGMIRNIS